MLREHVLINRCQYLFLHEESSYRSAFYTEIWTVRDKYMIKKEVSEIYKEDPFRISRNDRIRNEVIKERMVIEVKIDEDVENRKLTWYAGAEWKMNEF